MSMHERNGVLKFRKEGEETITFVVIMTNGMA